jgi:serine phosphatase RsbU (regulator of sigma subunit)
MESLSLVEWSIASRPASEGTATGDAAMVIPRSQGYLIAVLDAVGHGSEAETAALAATSVLQSNPEMEMRALVRLCHQRLRREPRGVAMSLALVDGAASTLSWLGVGNVQGILVRQGMAGTVSPRFLIARGGVVGRHLPEILVENIPLRMGDVLVFATDGISADFVASVGPGSPPQRLAGQILSRFHRGHDDSLVLATVFLGAT